MLAAMNTQVLIDGLISYLCFIPLLTFHEFAHAWVAWKCGDNTARDQGRVTLNPIAHIDTVGTIVLPLLSVFLGATAASGLSSFIIGWGRPVPVNLSNLSKPRWHDTLIALAGPAMNVLLAIAIVGIGKIAGLFGAAAVVEMADRLAVLSLFLCFFNMLPIPPLDGSHVVKNLIRMKHETYWQLCQWGFIAVIIIWQIPAVRMAVELATVLCLKVIRFAFALPPFRGF